MFDIKELPNAFYRVSGKALILDETKEKFLVIKEKREFWELPGGAIDWGEDAREAIPREIEEEMGLHTTWVADSPAYFYTSHDSAFGLQKCWKALVVYETTVKDLNFTPSDECIDIQFVSIEGAKEIPTSEIIQDFIKVFDPKNHV